jgi:hypothetical protein
MFCHRQTTERHRSGFVRRVPQDELAAGASLSRLLACFLGESSCALGVFCRLLPSVPPADTAAP